MFRLYFLMQGGSQKQILKFWHSATSRKSPLFFFRSDFVATPQGAAVAELTPEAAQAGLSLSRRRPRTAPKVTVRQRAGLSAPRGKRRGTSPEAQWEEPGVRVRREAETSGGGRLPGLLWDHVHVHDLDFSLQHVT